MTRTASCSCGALRAICAGEPLRVSICHCHACQRRTGSTYGMQLRFPADAVTTDGPATVYIRTGDSGGAIRFSFCPTCGATVSYTIDALPGFIAVPAGAFADSALPPPTVSIYESRRHAWVGLPAGIERYD